MQGAMLAVALVAPVTVTVVPPETLRTTAAYDDGARRLTLRCDGASRGACRFVVRDGGRTRPLVIRPGAGAVLTGVSPAAAFCVGGLNEGGGCDWTPVRTSGR